MQQLSLRLLPPRLAICRLDASEPIPAWAASARFHSITHTADELSIVCEEDAVPAGVRHEPCWRVFQVQGPLPFSATGILAAMAGPLAEAGIPIFAISTFSTDYLLVKDADAGRAATVLTSAGHRVVDAISPLPEQPTKP